MTSRVLVLIGLVGLGGCSFEGNSGTADTPDAPVDSPIDGTPMVNTCPTSYQLVVGTPLTSRYRKLETAKDVAAQTALCVADGAHLVVVDNAAERAAIEDYGRNSKGYFWIGISDSETEGVWKTATGQVVAPADLPWGMKQPEMGPAAEMEDCVLQAGGKYYDFKCTSSFVAVCECD